MTIREYVIGLTVGVAGAICIILAVVGSGNEDKFKIEPIHPVYRQSIRVEDGKPCYCVVKCKTECVYSDDGIRCIETCGEPNEE